MSDLKLSAHKISRGQFKGSPSGNFVGKGGGGSNHSVVISDIAKKTNLLAYKDQQLGQGGNKMHGGLNPRPNTAQVISSHELFQGDDLLEAQVVIAIISQLLRDDRQLYYQVLAEDWLNNIIDDRKTKLLINLGSMVSDVLGVKYDLVNHYSQGLKEFIEAMAQLTAQSKDYNINLPMYFKLLKTGLLTVDPTDVGYVNGQKLLHNTYDGSSESIKTVCSKVTHNRSQCTVQYIKDLIKNETASTSPTDLKLRSTLTQSFNNVALSFSTKKGYNSIYSLIFSYLKK